MGDLLWRTEMKRCCCGAVLCCRVSGVLLGWCCVLWCCVAEFLVCCWGIVLWDAVRWQGGGGGEQDGVTRAS